MISVPHSMQPTHTSRFTTNGIERVTTTLLLPNACRLQVVLVYRLPCVSLDAFLSALATVLNHVAVSDIPSVVLGDFKGGTGGSTSVLQNWSIFCTGSLLTFINTAWLSYSC